LPFLVLALECGEAALDLLLLGDGPHRRRAHLDQRVLHLLDDQPDQLLGILGAVEDGVDVGVNYVGEAGKDPHCHRPLLLEASVASLHPPKQASCQPRSLSLSL